MTPILPKHRRTQDGESGSDQPVAKPRRISEAADDSSQMDVTHRRVFTDAQAESLARAYLYLLQLPEEQAQEEQ